MRSSKKNQGNDLLPQRRPRLGKFILLAVILHVVFAVFLIHFYKKKPEEEPGIKVKSQKVISKPLAKEVLHTVRPESSASLVTQSRPMSPAISMAFEDRTPSVPLARKRAWKPRLDVKSRKVISKPLAKEVRHTVRPESSASLVTQSRPMSPAISMAFEDRTPRVPLARKRARKPRLDVKSRKVISKPLVKEVRHTVRPESSASLVTESRPMSPAISMAFEDRTPSVPLARKRARKPRLDVKSRKVISKPLAKEVRHAFRPESSASLVTQSRPMSPAISMAFEDRIPSVPLAHKRSRKPSPLHMPVLELTPGIKSETLSVRTVMAGNQKSNAEHLVPMRKMPVNSRLVTTQQVKAALPSKIVGPKPTAPILETFSAQVRIIEFEESDKRAKAWPIERADPAEVQLAFLSERQPALPKIPRTPFQVSIPSLHSKTGAFETVIKTKGLVR